MEEFELEPGESVILLVRKHWIVPTVQLIILSIAAALPLGLLPILSFMSAIQPDTVARVTPHIVSFMPYFKFATAFWWLFLWMAAYKMFISYYLTMWVITSMRIVDIHQYGFFSREVSSFLLNRVQDVTVNMHGFIPTIFSFGSLSVETAGRSEEFSMDDIVNPQGIRDLIMREVNALNGGAKAGSVPVSTGI